MWGKQDRLHAKAGACTQGSQDLSNRSVLPPCADEPSASEQVRTTSAPGELRVTGARLLQRSALLPFGTGKGHCSLAQSSIPVIVT